MDDETLQQFIKTAEAIVSLEQDVRRLEADRLLLQTLCGYLLAVNPAGLSAVRQGLEGRTEELTLALPLSESQRERIAEVLDQVLGQIQRWKAHRGLSDEAGYRGGAEHP